MLGHSDLPFKAFGCGLHVAHTCTGDTVALGYFRPTKPPPGEEWGGGKERENKNRFAKMSFRKQNSLPLDSCEYPLVKPLGGRILAPEPLLQ